MFHICKVEVSHFPVDQAGLEFAVTLVLENYIDFGPTFAAEKLAEDHGLKVSRETLRKWMQDAGIWLSTARQGMHSMPERDASNGGDSISRDYVENVWANA